MDEMDEMEIRACLPGDKAGLLDLWTQCNLINPKNDPEKDILRKSQSSPGWILVGVMDGRLVASAMVGYEGHRGWINYLAVHPSCRRKGLGRLMLERAEQELQRVGCPKINLQIRKGNEAVRRFYEKVGFVEDEVISMGKRMVDDSEPKAGSDG